MTMKIRVKVTAQDIAAGKPNDCRHCPVALACVRAVPGERAPFGVVVSDDRIWAPANVVDYGRPRWDVKAPASARRLILDFDAGRDVAPIAFKLDIRS